MTEEKSCGFVLFRKDEEILYLLLHYKEGHWGFVKGHIEKKEDEITTAIRETREETGIIDIRLYESFEEATHYTFKRENSTISKDVTFFLAETREKEVRLSHEHTGYKWLNYEDTLKQLTFDGSKEVLKKASIFLEKQKLF